MNPQPHNKVPALKVAIVFTGIMLAVNAVANLIGISFKTDYFLSLDYLKFEIGLEATVLFLCALLTILTTSKLRDFNLERLLSEHLFFQPFTCYLRYFLN